MATILHKRNAGAGITPELEELTLGELAINTVDGKVFTKINNGSESIIEIGSDSGGATSELEPYADGWRLNGWELDPGPDGLRFTTGVRSLDFTYFASDIYCGAPGDYSMAVGVVTEASGYGSLSTGYATKATGDYSRAGGAYSIASGEQSHAEGYFAESIGVASHAEGQSTIALNENSHAAGSYNVGSSIETIHETGIGTNDYDRKNAFEIYNDGRIRAPELTPSLQQDLKSLVTKDYAVTSATDNTTGEVRIASIVKITQADYDAIANKDLDKLYIIVAGGD